MTNYYLLKWATLMLICCIWTTYPWVYSPTGNINNWPSWWYFYFLKWLIFLKIFSIPEWWICPTDQQNFCPSKTKLVAFNDNKLAHLLPLESFLNLISISNSIVPLKSHAEHIGVICDSCSIFLHIFNIISAQKKANAIIKLPKLDKINLNV